MGATHPGRISATALRVAVRRAAHQLLDSPPVFEDPLALRIIGEREATKLRARIGPAERPWNNSLRAWIAARSRYAEDQLAAAVHCGITEYIILGAGLDTFAYRNPYPKLRVWEVDTAASQAAKREMLQAAGIDIPPTLTFLPVDLETQPLQIQTSSPAFVSWLGVTPFLTRRAFDSTLAAIAPITAQIVFDYAVTREALDAQDRFAFDILSRRVAAAGEPYRLFFPPYTHPPHFAVLEDLGKEEINARYFAHRNDNLAVAFTPARLVSCVPAKRFDTPAW